MRLFSPDKITSLVSEMDFKIFLSRIAGFLKLEKF